VQNTDVWICPTFSRPHRLAKLAETWRVCEQNRPLYVHVSAQDPQKEEYAKRIWPESWEFYSTDERHVTPILNGFWRQHPHASSIGFVADDILLHTPVGLELLACEAESWYIAYPNDLLQRHRLCTHFCVGGKLIETVGWFANPRFVHHFIDTTWYLIGVNTGLLRYCPEVIFEHVHPLAGKVQEDEVYKYANSLYGEGLRRWQDYQEHDAIRDVKRVLAAITREFEPSGSVLRGALESVL
jgi:hypothetical protein